MKSSISSLYGSSQFLSSNSINTGRKSVGSPTLSRKSKSSVRSPTLSRKASTRSVTADKVFETEINGKMKRTLSKSLSLNSLLESKFFLLLYIPFFFSVFTKFLMYTAKSQFLLRIILLILRKKLLVLRKKIACFKKILGKPKWLTIRTLLVLRKKFLKISNFFLKIRINFLKIIFRKKIAYFKKKITCFKNFFS